MKLVWIFIGIAGAIGTYLPVVFGASPLSGWSLFGSFIGSLFGLWLFVKLDLND